LRRDFTGEFTIDLGDGFGDADLLVECASGTPYVE
jgi:hypothetical protein